TPTLRAIHDSPPSRDSNTPTAEMPPHMRSVAVGWGMIVWRMSPPAPGPQVGRDGWLVRPSTCDQVAPPSVLRNRPAGSTAAEIVSTGPGARVHAVAIGSASSP